MSIEQPQIDPEVVAELRSILVTGIDERLKTFRSEIERRMKELSSRAPSILTGGGSGAPATRSLPLLGADQKFHSWLRGPRGKSSAYAASFEGFRLEQKASPLINTGGAVHVGGIAQTPTLALRLVELMPVVPMNQGAAAEYGRETSFTPNAAIVPEGQTKPTTTVDYANVLASIKTIATITKASLQSLADTPGMGDWLDGRLRYAVQLKAEDHLLNAAAPDGLLASAGAIDAAFAPPADGTPLDIVGAAIAQLQASGYTVDGAVMNGSDVARMRLLKDGTDNYLWASPDSALGTASVWSVPLVISPSMPAGSWLVGAFGQCTLLFQRQILVVEVAYENEDDFSRNLCTLRAEERIGSAIPIPAGLVKGTFPAPAPGMRGAPSTAARK